MCTSNIRYFTNPLHYTANADLADSLNIDVFAHTETWISPNTTSAQLVDAIPRGFTSIITPRSVPDSSPSWIVGGGTAFLLREPCKLLSLPTATFKSSELFSIPIKLLTLFWFYIIYIVLLNLLYQISALCVFMSVSRRLPNSHRMCINFPSWIS